MKQPHTTNAKKTSDELATFQGTTDTRLAKIESIISKIYEIDNLKPEVEKLEEEVSNMKQSVNTMVNETRNLFQECIEELKRRVERLERYSTDFNIRVVGVFEQDGEDCLLIIHNLYFLALEMTLTRLRTPTVLEENERKNQALLSNSITDLLSECFFLSLRIRKTSKH